MLSFEERELGRQMRQLAASIVVPPAPPIGRRGLVPLWPVLASLAIAVIVLAIVARPATRGGDMLSPGSPAPGATLTPSPSPSAAPSTTPVPPTPAPLPPTPTPSPVVLRGDGGFASSLALPFPASAARFTHGGTGSFTVTAVVGDDPTLQLNVKTTGAYDGERLITSNDFGLVIEANGAWTATFRAVTCCATDPAFAGRGDRVSAMFRQPPQNAMWEFAHDGRSNFLLYAHCSDRYQEVLNRIGSFEESRVLSLGGEWCFWEVRGDGNWSIRPR